MNIIETGLKLTSTVSRRRKTTRIILHHAAASECDAATIHRWHLNNGWAGIGYHFVVRKNGAIERGRAESLVGAHVTGANSDSIGICFEGNYDVETSMPTAQIKAGQDLVAYLKYRYDIQDVKGHRDVGSSSCPGRYFPFAQIAGVEAAINPTVNNSQLVKPQTTSAAPNNDISQLQAECNRQGFSNQKVDGIAGPITLKGCPTCSYGAKGNITKWIQTKLNSMGYNCGASDGIFGVKTRDAVKAFQKDRRIGVDGIVGVNTWMKLLGM